MKKGFFVIITVLSLLVVAAAAFADPEYDAGLKDYYGRHYKSAVVRLKAYVEKKPDPAAYYLIGYSLYKLRRFHEATEYFNQAYLIDPNFSPEKYGLGKELAKTKTKAGRSRRKASRHSSVKKCQTTPEKQKAPEKKVSSSSASKPDQKKPR